MELAIGSIMSEIFSSYSNTYYFNYLIGNKELLARQVALSHKTFDDGTFQIQVLLTGCGRGQMYLCVSHGIYRSARKKTYARNLFYFFL